MNRREAKVRVNELLAGGHGRGQIFDTLSGSGVSDRFLAGYIATRPSPVLNQRYKGLNYGLVVLVILQGLLATAIFLVMTWTGPQLPIGLLIGLCALIVAVTGLFAWGFLTHRSMFYRLFVTLGILQLVRSFSDGQIDTAAIIGLVIGGAILSYGTYVHAKLYPDLAFLGPRRVGGRYVFTDAGAFPDKAAEVF